MIVVIEQFQRSPVLPDYPEQGLGLIPRQLPAVGHARDQSEGPVLLPEGVHPIADGDDASRL
jgi:hypothetical protein